MSDPRPTASAPDPGETPAEEVSRRDVLRKMGWGGAALGAGLVGGVLGSGGPAGAEPDAFLYGSTTAPAQDYHGAFDPPAHLGAHDLDAVAVPPPAVAASPEAGRDIVLDVLEVDAEVAAGVQVRQWTYNGTAPGPVLRAELGDEIRLTLRNRTGRAHNVHFHGRHSPLQDGWEPVPPGGEATYRIEAGPVGVHPYHCHTPPLAHHVATGLYGTFIVDPPEGRRPAHEFVLLLSGWDPDGAGRNALYTWNGVAGFYDKYPIKVPVGELVRVYLINMTEYDPVASFHLHAQTFDVYRSGTSLVPDEHTDTLTLGQAERAIIEFTLPELGRYMFHPHQHHMASAGAMGWFAAI